MTQVEINRRIVRKVAETLKQNKRQKRWAYVAKNRKIAEETKTYRQISNQGSTTVHTDWKTKKDELML